MILRKPYKFLIKHFKLIHLLLFLPVVYLLIKTNNIFKFFSSYVSNNYTYSTISNLAGSYINFFMYLAILLIVIVALIVYYLMRQKKKNTKLYIAFIVYYLILFVALTVYHGVLSNLEIEELTAKAARAYRDISLIITLPQYFFAFYSIFRGLGFDIKQFKFELDLKDLDIDEKDNEEFEFVLGVETYKYKRTLRRFIREFKYYILENKFIFTCISIILFLVVATTLYMHFNVYNKSYGTNKTFSHSAFNMNMLDSMITNVDYNGKTITKGKYYLVLKINIINNSVVKTKLDTNNFRLQMGNSYLVPTLDRSDYFIDFGTPYHGEKININTNTTYNLVFELTEKQVKNSYKLKILENIEYKVGDITAHYKILNIKPKRIIDNKNISNYKMNENISLESSNLKDSSIKVKNYEIKDNYIYSYQLCSNNVCRNLNDVVSTGYGTSKVKTTLLILDLETKFDKNTEYYKAIKNTSKFYEDFFTVEYNGKEVTTRNVTPDNLKDKIILQTNAEIKESSNLNLLITIRNYCYKVTLKG